MAQYPDFLLVSAFGIDIQIDWAIDALVRYDYRYGRVLNGVCKFIVFGRISVRVLDR